MSFLPYHPERLNKNTQMLMYLSSALESHFLHALPVLHGEISFLRFHARDFGSKMFGR